MISTVFLYANRVLCDIIVIHTIYTYKEEYNGLIFSTRRDKKT